MHSAISWLRRVYRWFPSRPFRKELAGLYHLYLRLTGNVVRAQVEGNVFDLDLRELIDSTIYFEGGWEPATVAMLKRIVMPGHAAVDVGANMGYYTLLLAKLVGDTGKVIAFEPMSSAYARSSRNLELNCFPNVVAERMALADFAGQEIVSFMTSWRLDLKVTMPPPEAVTFETLDAYVQQHPQIFPRVDLIKLDVGGHEDAVLRGAAQVLRDKAPTVLLEVGRGTEESIRFLAGLGYSFYSVPAAELYDDIASLQR